MRLSHLVVVGLFASLFVVPRALADARTSAGDSPIPATDEPSSEVAPAAPADDAGEPPGVGVDRTANLAPESGNPFDRPFAFAGYATVQGGSYLGAGVGGRARWEPHPRLGAEVYLELTSVHVPGDAFRIDLPNGFNLYSPFESRRLRIRPYAGFCDILSFLRSKREGAPRANDVLVGVHLGLGGEYALDSYSSLFVDVQTNFYAGHGRTAQGWTGGVDGELAFFWYAQLNVGLQFHAGR